MAQVPTKANRADVQPLREQVALANRLLQATQPASGTFQLLVYMDSALIGTGTVQR